MSYAVYDLKEFYSRRAGRLVRRLLSGHISEFWPDVKDQRVVGYGYPMPYLRPMQEQAERVCAVLPARNGGYFWPEGQKGLVCMSEEAELPFETESIDRLLVVHGLEYAESPEQLFHEFWRVLKSNGRLLLIVPNRLGMWARVDRTPFGHGTPYTLGQIHNYLQKSLFVMENKTRGLYMPPFRSFLVLRSVYTFEGFGKFIFPGLAGVHLIEASKQIYGGVPKTERGKGKGRRIIVGAPVPT